MILHRNIRASPRLSTTALPNYRGAHKAERIARWQQGREREPILDFIETGLADWFVKHVNTRDYITTRFLTLGHA